MKEGKEFKPIKPEEYRRMEGITPEDEKHRKEELFLSAQTEADKLEKKAREELTRPVTDQERKSHEEAIKKEFGDSGPKASKEQVDEAAEYEQLQKLVNTRIREARSRVAKYPDKQKQLDVLLQDSVPDIKVALQSGEGIVAIKEVYQNLLANIDALVQKK